MNKSRKFIISIAISLVIILTIIFLFHENLIAFRGLKIYDIVGKNVSLYYFDRLFSISAEIQRYFEIEKRKILYTLDKFSKNSSYEFLENFIKNNKAYKKVRVYDKSLVLKWSSDGNDSIGYSMNEEQKKLLADFLFGNSVKLIFDGTSNLILPVSVSVKGQELFTVFYFDLKTVLIDLKDNYKTVKRLDIPYRNLIFINFPAVGINDTENIKRVAQEIAGKSRGAIRVRSKDFDEVLYYTSLNDIFKGWKLILSVESTGLKISTGGYFILFLQSFVLLAFIIFIIASLKEKKRIFKGKAEGLEHYEREKKEKADGEFLYAQEGKAKEGTKVEEEPGVGLVSGKMAIENKSGENVEISEESIEKSTTVTSTIGEKIEEAEEIEEVEQVGGIKDIEEEIEEVEEVEEIEETEEIGDVLPVEEVEEVEEVQEIGEAELAGEVEVAEEISEESERVEEVEEAEEMEEVEESVDEAEEVKEADFEKGSNNGIESSNQVSADEPDQINQSIDLYGDINARYEKEKSGFKDKANNKGNEEIEKDIEDIEKNNLPPLEGLVAVEKAVDDELGEVPSIPEELFKKTSKIKPEDELSRLIEEIESDSEFNRERISNIKREFIDILNRLNVSKGVILFNRNEYFFPIISVNIDEETKKKLRFTTDEKVYKSFIGKGKVLFIKEDAFESDEISKKFSNDEKRNINALLFYPVKKGNNVVAISLLIISKMYDNSEVIFDFKEGIEKLKALKELF